MSLKLTVKTLKGEKFQVDVEPSNTVAEVKGIVESTKSEMPAEGMKLIHSGKILKDTDTIESCHIKPSDFLVVMISKPKKAAAPAPALAAAAAPETPAPAPPAAASNSTTTSTTTPAETPAASAPAAAAAAPPAPARPADTFSAETVATLTALGFPEAEVRHCLRAANGNPDIAVEFLTNGIPPGIPAAGTAAASPSGNASGQPLAALRAHPQFDALRRLVQSNPQMLQQVLTQIGQQQPELLQEINANQALFLQMMNEPVSDTSTSGATSTGATSSPRAPTGAGAPPPGLMEGMANPQQMAAMLQNMNPQELQQMATMMGMSPEQLQQTARLIGQIPPDQLQNVMMQAMQAGGEGMGGMGGAPQAIRLNEEEMAAVDRLTEMGFDRADAAQAFLACDKNEALAANLLMDSAGQEGGVFGFRDDDDNNDNGGGSGDGNDNDGDDMYD